MALMINGKEVSALALGNNEFYSMTENGDDSISFKGHTFIWKPKASSSPLMCFLDSSTTPYRVHTDLSNKLKDYSSLTVKDLINKGEMIELTVTFDNTSAGTSYISNSGIIDLSKPDSKGHFNFRWIDRKISSNTYCYPDSGANTFSVYSDLFSTFPNDFYNCYMVIQSDEI